MKFTYLYTTEKIKDSVLKNLYGIFSSKKIIKEIKEKYKSLEDFKRIELDRGKHIIVHPEYYNDLLSILVDHTKKLIPVNTVEYTYVVFETFQQFKEVFSKCKEKI